MSSMPAARSYTTGTPHATLCRLRCCLSRQPPYKRMPACLPSTGEFIKYPSERRDADTLNMWVKTLTGF